MTSSKVNQLIALAEELSGKIDKTIIQELEEKKNVNIQFEAQREFGRQLYRKLRSLIGELSGDLFVLKERQFDPDMWRLAAMVKRDLEGIILRVKESRPHDAAQEIINYVTDRSTGSIVDNLDFLIEHHLKATEPEINLPHNITHVEVNAFKHLKQLAHELQEYIDEHPLLDVPSTSPPPSTRGRNPLADPKFLAPPEAKTKV